MSATTSIEWAVNADGSPGKSWNTLAGCERYSPGCVNCYAQSIAYRFSSYKRSRFFGLARMSKSGPAWTGEVREVPRALKEPMTWRSPMSVFANSMTDLFHKDVSDEFIGANFGVMAACPQHRFMVLTKRAERLPEWFEWAAYGQGGPRQWCAYVTADYVDGVPCSVDASEDKLAGWPLANVWLGVSVEDVERKDRIDHLRRTPAAIRFVSFEPLLEDLGELNLAGIHWAIIGGESGHKARPFNADWARNIIRQCRAADVKVFFKQGGAKFCDERNGVVGAQLRVPEDAAQLVSRRLKSKKGGALAELPEDLRVRETPLGWTQEAIDAAKREGSRLLRVLSADETW